MHEYERSRTSSTLLHVTHMQIAQYQGTVTANSELCSDMNLWFEVRARMNGASWHDVAHYARPISRAADASSIGWGAFYEDPPVQWRSPELR